MPEADKQLEQTGDSPSSSISLADTQSATEFVSYLRTLGMDIHAKDGKLILNAPANAVTVELQTELKRRKPQLLALFEREDHVREERTAPLSYAQQRLWLIDRFSPGTPAYNIPQSWIIESDLDVDLLRRALDRLTERHAALRTCIDMRNGEPVQIIRRRVATILRFTDLSHSLLDTDAESRIQALLVEDGREPFVLSEAPLIRFHIVRLAPDRHLVSYNVHHIVADQWSLDILSREFVACYIAEASNTPANLPPLSMGYAGVAEREHSEVTRRLHERQLEHWRTRLKDLPMLLELPFSKSRPSLLGYAGSTLSLELNADITERLRRLAIRNNTSLYLLMLAVFFTLLYRYTGLRDLCVGTPVTGRKRREEEGIIGLFVNMLPLRSVIDPEEAFDAYLLRMGSAVLDDFEHGDVPFQKLVTELHPQRSGSYSPLFQVMYALNAFGSGTEDAQRETFIGISKFDLTLQITERQHSLEVHLEYRTDLFLQEDIERFGKHFVRLAESVVNEPGLPIKSLPLLTDCDLIAIRKRNNTSLAFDAESTLIGLFEDQARLHPDAVALYHETAVYSFRQLEDKASRLALALVAKGAGRGSFIAVCLDRSPSMLVAILAILKTGAAYLPLDPKYPEDRIAYMLEDSGAGILVAEQNELSTRLGQNRPTLSILSIDEDSPVFPQIAAAPESGSIQTARHDDPAYLIYTSGSTGRPKGVIVEHRNAVALIAWAKSYFAPESLRVVLASTSICFDLSIFEVFVPLLTGNSVVLVENLLQLPLSPFAEKVTLVNTVPSAMSALLSVGLPKNAEVVSLAGEFLPTELVDQIHAAGALRVFDLYGPTETTTYSMCALRLPGAEATIGKPIANTSIYLLDENGGQVPPGAMGEIYIGGAGVTRGYLGQPALTEARFLSIAVLEPGGKLYRTGDYARQRQDGAIVYLGRQDQQIKLRGHRIELGEIEAALREVSGITQIAVVVQRRESGDTLVAFFQDSGLRAKNVEAWRAALRKQLPAYMVPSLIVPEKKMPLTPNGKIDRRALRLMQAEQSNLREGAGASRAPRNILEQWVANIWAHRLGLDSVDRDAHFFEDLSGHSLVAFEIFAEIERRMCVALPLTLLLQAPTVELLADLIRQYAMTPLTHLKFKRSGTAKAVVYLLGNVSVQTAVRENPSDERIVGIDTTSGFEELDKYVREIAAFEATKPPLRLIGPDTQSEEIYQITLALNTAGFADVAVHFVAQQ